MLQTPEEGNLTLPDSVLGLSLCSQLFACHDMTFCHPLMPFWAKLLHPANTEPILLREVVRSVSLCATDQDRSPRNCCLISFHSFSCGGGGVRGVWDHTCRHSRHSLLGLWVKLGHWHCGEAGVLTLWWSWGVDTVVKLGCRMWVDSTDSTCWANWLWADM